MDDDRLIELVRSNVVLYDTSQPKYIDTSLKDKIWQDIGQELNQSVTACKFRWNNIRDNYRKSLYKRKGQRVRVRGRALKRYKFEDQVSFLLPFLRAKEGLSDASQDDFLVDFDATDDVAPRPIKSDDTDDCESPAPAHHLEPKRPPPAPLAPDRRRRRRTEAVEWIEDSSPDSSNKYYILGKKEQSNQTEDQPHPIDAFLAGLSPTLKSLTPYYLNLAKNKIFAAVQEYEMTQIMETQFSGLSDKRPTTTAAVADEGSAVVDATSTQSPLMEFIISNDVKRVHRDPLSEDVS